MIHIDAELRLDNTLSPTALAANTNDYAPTNIATATGLRLDASAPVNLTGLTSGTSGRVLALLNVSAANAITLTHEDAGSTAANRFTLPSGASLAIPPGGAALLMYDATSARWRVLARST